MKIEKKQPLNTKEKEAIVIVSASMPTEMVNEIDDVIGEEYASRSHFIRLALQEKLNSIKLLKAAKVS